jgi:HAD superfamily hydrolase (TIGR01484 family)
MLFASDLDRTLIYSKRFLDKCKKKPLLIETKDDKEISFMTEASVSILKKITNRILFIPVTTRTIEQYKRISFLKNVIVPKYAIVSNGGNILINGKIDSYWSKIVSIKIKSESISSKKVLERFNEIKNNEWIYKQKEADNLFYYFIIDKDNIPLDEIADFKKWLLKYGWNISIQGRKLYIVPKFVSKSSAVNYIKNKTGKNKIIASGDSLLDLSMLEHADIAFCPSHGEIYNSYKEGSLKVSKHIVFTDNQGMSASEEILKKVEKLTCDAKLIS